MSSYKTRVVKPGDLAIDDVVIAFSSFMGLTGSGKSQIIDTLAGQPGERAGNSLKSVTKDVAAFRVLKHQKYGDKLVLVDSPGFDNTTKSDKYILEMISNWLSRT